MREEAGRAGSGKPVSVYMRSAMAKILSFSIYVPNVVFKSVLQETLLPLFYNHIHCSCNSVCNQRAAILAGFLSHE